MKTGQENMARITGRKVFLTIATLIQVFVILSNMLEVTKTSHMIELLYGICLDCSIMRNTTKNYRIASVQVKQKLKSLNNKIIKVQISTF